ncbi:EpsG family protein (plasmid) [Escherichia coli]|uniref:EpsG family protein n=1 Tax=Escherichia coli TaxID=562 RepID=UPI00185BE847|nr:EpsG family protein [Escherichia coli]EFD1143405.1 hypothetical protein [Escherichia coli]UFK76700.1 EpsG family protein [Escherichia coli]
MIYAFAGFFTGFYGLSVFCVFIIAVLCREFRLPNFALLCSIFIIIVLSFLYGFRSIDSGTDTVIYHAWFDSISKGSTNREFEPFFVLFGHFVNLFTNDAFIFIFIVSIIQLLYVFKALLSLSGIIVVPLSLVISVSFLSGVDLISNTIRNGLSIAISSYAVIRYLGGAGIVKYLIIIMISSMMHSSCIIFMIIPVVRRFLNEKYALRVFYTYVFIYLLSFLNVFEFLFYSLNNIGVGALHVVDRIIAFKVQDIDMLGGSMKYYFFVITLIPFLLIKFGFYVNKQLFTIHYVLLIPYAIIFLSPSSYRFSYISFYICVFIIAQAVYDSKSLLNRLLIYFAILAMILLTYTTNTMVNYKHVIY